MSQADGRRRQKRRGQDQRGDARELRRHVCVLLCEIRERCSGQQASDGTDREQEQACDAILHTH
jgi:hypothetical protein